MAKATLTAAELQRLLLEQIGAKPELQGILTEAYRARVVGVSAVDGGPNWMVWSATDIGQFRGALARIIRTLQTKYNMDE